MEESAPLQRAETRRSALRCGDDGSELVRRLRHGGSLPGIVGRGAGGLHRRLVERGRDALAVVDDDGADTRDADAPDEGRGALSVFRILAIELGEAAGVEQHIVLVVDDTQHMALARVRGVGAADVDLPLAVADRDRADILDQRLRAVARAARGRELELAGSVDTAKPALDLDREPNAVAESEAAVVDTDAALAGALVLARPMSGGVVEAGVALVHVFAAPDCSQERSERRLARGILGTAGELAEYRRHRLEPLLADRRDEIGLPQRDRRHVGVRRSIFPDLPAA